MADTAPFSLLLPVYRGDDARFLRRAFTSSVHDQTLRPDEVIVVRDGPVPDEVEAVLRDLETESPVPTTVLRLPDNIGLAHALRKGLAACTHEIVARMDADDISLPERFERQLAAMTADGLDMVGAGMFEFLEDNGKVLGRRTPPSGLERIRSYSRFHDPFNHPTVVYRKQAVHKAGGYQELGLMEDYWLFVRMIHSGAIVDNVPAPLLMYRVGAGAYRRRGGYKQLVAELRLQREFRRIHFTTRRQMLRNIGIRASYRLVPVGIRQVIYRAFIANPGARKTRSARVE
ncbi:glycosyltransferase [Herbiconiux sp. L3-i23]|uniref:glycosyltransferase n=1 Tax=Herbiconiux sp. L3-i23 TaxID=2905871 RepID=UPI002050E07A|nr:glycosyltransferase [Herbiconiux sp. L3-i23]BDI21617.1 glycosyl hydrolase [Herbiconiux sp. L3-i23]